MTAWRWISKQALLLLHGESLAEHGGAAGMRDEGLLDSALARAPNLATYDEPDAAALAATYGFGIARNHPFIDGNKRAAFLSVGLFLALNGYRLAATQAEATVIILALAAGEIDEAEFAAWLRGHVTSR
ncbi:MAG: type II toxin-antitoxin system death-on-curing family toxin [Rhodocyclaceae bacterium]|jgi:death-on-curing protein|nr:type II toxin-antitoxin system death-on-curing family toxin [Rhodocyclaceae bacterium]